MFLHIGNNAVVRDADVIGVFDMENTTISKSSRSFLSNAQKNGEITDICEDLPKSYIITDYDSKNRIYISSVSSQTIYKRAENNNIIIGEKI